MSQSGFRASHSTLDNLCRLEHDARHAMLTRRYCVAVFLDVTRAFDSVWHHGLMQKIESLGLCGRLARFIQSFIALRRIRVKISSTQSNDFPLYAGVPQGSVLSPTLFNIFINDFFHSVPNNVCTSLFADDGALWVTASSLQMALRSVQSALDGIMSWSHCWGLEISVAKTFSIIFTRCRIVSPPPLLLDTAPIPFVKSARFLGIIFDSRLTWHKHFSYLQDCCRRDLQNNN